MTSSNLTKSALAAIAIAASALFSQAQAAVVFISPASQDATVGATVGADIFVSGLTQALGGFAFNLNYDASRLQFSGFQADPDLKMGDLLNPAIDVSLGKVGASVDFLVLAGFTLPADEATLFGLQGSGAQFRLGHVDWLALNTVGTASLSLSGLSLSDYGGATIDSQSRNATVCVGGNCNNNVPEPTTALLVAAALGALALSRKQKKA